MKTIIYITHDLDFAASRTDANKIWIKSYSGGNNWTWDEVPNDELLPENLVLEVIGSRKKILFCEGDTGSYDVTIYQIVYPSYHVIPRGSCTKVIESTKALRNNSSLLHLNAVGIIDSDYRDPAEVEILVTHGVQTIAVAEIENIFCVESALRVVAEHLEQDPNDVVREVVKYISKALKDELEFQISSMAERRIQYLLGAYSKSSNDKIGLSNGISVTLDRIDVEAIYNECQATYNYALSTNNLDQLLRVYNRKSLSSRISGILGLANGEYMKLLVRLIKGPKRDSLVTALQQYMPTM